MSRKWTIEAVDRTEDHWLGRSEGRHWYACHLTLEQWPEVRALAGGYQAAMGGVDGFDLIPARWLHLTVQSIGFVDEVETAAVERIVANLRSRLATWPSHSVTFHRPVVRPEAIYLPALPAAPLSGLRAQVRAAIGDVLGPAKVNGRPQAYRPHVSIAYSNTSQPTAAIVEALTAVTAKPVTVRVREVALLEFHRDRRMYEWTSEQPIPLSTR